MKIFLSFFQSAVKHPIPAYSFWQFYIKNGIEEAGHEWSECPDVDWALGMVSKSASDQQNWKEDSWSKTVEWLKKHPADLFLSYLYPAQIDVTSIRDIQKMGIPCVNFFCDNIRDFTVIPPEFAVFDLNWVPEYEAAALYKKAKYPFINLPMPMWVAPSSRVFKSETNHQITFIGSKEIQRHLFFESVALKAPELPLAIYGAGWNKDYVPSSTTTAANYTLSNKLLFQLDFVIKQGVKAYWRKLKQRGYDSKITPALQLKTKGLISDDQYNKLTAESMITIGINRYPSYRFPLAKPNAYSRLRDIEAPMLGACYLTEWAPGIEELYHIGTEIEVFKNAEEFIDKAKELSVDSQKRKTLKVNGQKRALQDHSIPTSLKIIEQMLGS